ncbi:hypothetical protein [uncultured Jannaschia sp.]|uniref:esterase/lipase family protein n=1 Tax=uncultured Jannaschia sp. TaxID=293347 RepID=UPI0026028CDC|nr:hypothetical protein [uncultured Jannaschia sp.]
MIRGFGGLDTSEERKLAYQGFNVGSVYPLKRGENYVYEGFILKLMKAGWQFHDATNVVGFYPNESTEEPPEGSIIPPLDTLPKGFFHGDRIIIDPAMALSLLKNAEDPCKTFWVFRYYDLEHREFATYGKALVRLIDFIQALATANGKSTPKVNIVAHSMGGLIVREAVQITYPLSGRSAADHINKIVTLGTPHGGITFQVFNDLRWAKMLGLSAADDLDRFNPDNQKDPYQPNSLPNLQKCFPLERLLCVAGTNYRSYSIGSSSFGNRLFSVANEFGANYNRSDGLVKITNALVPDAPRAFVHKCHGGFDSLLTARESFEIATRFFFGDVRVRLRLMKAQVTRGFDIFGRSEFFFGIAVKPRKLDFELFHQSREAENCYGPFHQSDFDDPNPAFGWAGEDRLIWEGFLNSNLRDRSTDLVLRAEFYVGERDLLGIGFSDNVIFHRQYYVRAVRDEKLHLELHSNENFMRQESVFPESRMHEVEAGWQFEIDGRGFKATCQLELDYIPEDGLPVPIRPQPGHEKEDLLMA